MAYTTPVENYVRSPQPQLKESQQKYLEDEFRKLERVIRTMTEALAEADKRLVTGGL